MGGALEVEDGTLTKNAHEILDLPRSGEDMEEKNMDVDMAKKEYSVEYLFASMAVPPWWKQITVRGLLVSLVLGFVFSIITLKLSLSTGVIPSLNVSAGLLGFFFVKSYTRILSKLNISHVPFTRQENTVIQTCVVACYGLAFSGGFGSYMIALDTKTYNQVNVKGSSEHDSAADVKDPQLGWIISFMFAVGFLGLLAVVPLRKTMIIDYKLTYPSGTATAVLINSFHTPRGHKEAMMATLTYVKILMSLTYIGAGMICPHLINVSTLLGGILSWGLMWPLLKLKAGDWYPADAVDTNNLQGLYGYKVFVAIAVILGDGLYNFLKISFITMFSLYQNHKMRLKSEGDNALEEVSYEEQRRRTMFMKDRIPFKAAAACYMMLAVVSTIAVPHIFPQVKWYYIFISYCMAPVLGFCNAYGYGLTDWNLVTTYGKLGLFIFSAWAGSHGGVLVGLVSCGVMMVIVSCAADLMQDFKTGYLTLASPRSMFASQVIGTFMGCIIAPLTFWLFWNAFDIGNPNGEYKAPYAIIFREMAMIGVQGFGALPKHCVEICVASFCAAMGLNFLRDKPLARWAGYIPIPMAMAIPFYLGPYFAIDMFVGTVIVYVWQRLNGRKATLLVPAVASGLICGDGIWTLVSAILALAKKQAPICMVFLPSKLVESLNLPSF